MTRPNSRDAILDAVEEIVGDRGAAHLTLDAVAKQCGISKGGLMYNFPTKEALIQAVLGRFMARLDEARADARQKLGQEDCTELVVELLATLALPPRGLRVHAGLLAVVANEPSLLDQIWRNARARFDTAIQCAHDADVAAILYFAAMGLHFHDTLAMDQITSKQRKQICEKLVQMGKEASVQRHNATPEPGSGPTKSAAPTKSNGRDKHPQKRGN